MQQPAQVGLGRDELEHVGRAVAVPAQQVLDGDEVQAAGARRALAVGPGRTEVVGADDGDLVGRALGHRGPLGPPREEGLDGGIDDVGGHDAVGGPLAAGDVDEARRGGDDGVLPRERGGGVVGVPGREQGAQPGVDAHDVLDRQRTREPAVGLVDEVGDVLAGDRRLVERADVVGVGGADEPVLAPGQQEEHGARRPRDHGGRRPEGLARHHEVHALALPHVARGVGVEQLAQAVGPDPHGTEHHVGVHVEALAVVGAHRGPHDALALAQQPDHLDAGRDGGPPGRCAAGQRHRVAGVVGLRVVVAHGTHELVGVEAGGDAGHGSAGELLGAGHRAAVGAHP